MEINATSHAFDRAFDDGQPDAGAFVFFFAMDAAKDLEDAVAMLRGDANAVVFDVKAHPAFYTLSPDFDFGLLAAFDEFEGVAQEVGDALGEQRGVTEHGQERGLDLDLRSGGLELRVLLDDIDDQFVEIDRL